MDKTKLLAFWTKVNELFEYHCAQMDLIWQKSKSQSQLLFQLINRRYETGSIITSNLTFSQRQGILNNDEALTVAIMDRLIHHSHIVNMWLYQVNFQRKDLATNLTKLR